MNIKQICSQASATIDRADSELLLAHVLEKHRAYLYAYPEVLLTEEQRTRFDDYVKRRAKGEPLVYILGSAEFYGLSFDITPDVLVPRPETELLIDYVFSHWDQEPLSVLELGTGSGIISITLATQRPKWQFTATDISAEALAVAQRNALKLGVKKIAFLESDWFNNLESAQYDLIISNPPYIAENDPHLRALSYEPQHALVSGQQGMDAIQCIVRQAVPYLSPGGGIALEHGYNQAELVQLELRQCGYERIKTLCDFNHQPRVTIATRP